jgi:hypothetical protein
MIDYYHLADNQYHTQIYTGPIGTNSTLNIYYWIKPRGITMIHITAIGAGGGGGAGIASVIANAGSGGSGGGSGSITRLTIPAIFLPDSLRLVVAAGGNGGTTGGGNTAGNTFVEAARGSAVAATYVLQVNGGSGGTLGTAGGNVGGGGGGGLGAIINGVYQSLGTWVSVAGQSGANSGNAGNAGLVQTIVDTGLPITGGASGGGKVAGGGTSNAGGNITGFGSAIPTLPGGTSGVTGTSGVFSQTPFYSLGGAGGGADANGTGARGGNGNYGCGGGGGGAGVANGPGGNGGPSIVIITCW